MPNYLKYSRSQQASTVSSSRLNKLERDSLAILKQLLARSKRNIIAFSGGKDSVVTAHLCSMFGINEAVNESSFMFDKCKKETREIAHEMSLKLTVLDSLGWDWLKRNPQYCEPNMKLQSRLYAVRQQKSIKGYSSLYKYTGVIYGRRHQENTVKAPLYCLKNGQHQCHPLADWTTDDIWAYIAAKELRTPSLYNTEIGQKEGYTPYLLPPEHFGGCVWRAIYDYDPSVVKQFATFYEPAKAYLKTIQ